MIPATGNVQKNMDKFLMTLDPAHPPVLLLHSCCAPCSSYVLEYLSDYFLIKDFFYNPNITDRREFDTRAAELKRLIKEQPHKNPVTYIEGEYDKEEFLKLSKGLENVPEGGERCMKCFYMRLKRAAIEAKNQNADFVATTLTISPLKNAELINKIGYEVCAEAGVPYLPSDFKKKNGYLRSTELSKEYNLYRQNYCGCVFSKRDSKKESINAGTCTGS